MIDLRGRPPLVLLGLLLTLSAVATGLFIAIHLPAAILILMLLCAGLGYAIHLLPGNDMLTAFLATSPAGLDLIAVIAASTHVDMSQVMGMQVARFLLISFVGPTCIAMLALGRARHRAAAAGRGGGARDARRGVSTSNWRSRSSSLL